MSLQEAEVGVFHLPHRDLSDPSQATYAKGTKAELARDYDQALRLYINAAQAYLHLSRTFAHSSAASSPITSEDKQVRDKCKQEAKRCLERAERIKASRPSSELKPVIRNAYDEGKYDAFFSCTMINHMSF